MKDMIKPLFEVLLTAGSNISIIPDDHFKSRIEFSIWMDNGHVCRKRWLARHIVALVSVRLITKHSSTSWGSEQAAVLVTTRDKKAFLQLGYVESDFFFHNLLHTHTFKSCIKTGWKYCWSLSCFCLIPLSLFTLEPYSIIQQEIHALGRKQPQRVLLLSVWETDKTCYCSLNAFYLMHREMGYACYNTQLTVWKAPWLHNTCVIKMHESLTVLRSQLETAQTPPVH